MIRSLVFAAILLSISSCDPDDTIESVYVNETVMDVTIEYHDYFSNDIGILDIPALSTKGSELINLNSGKVPPVTVYGIDTCIIFFENGKKLFFSKDSSPVSLSIMDEASFNYETTGDKTYKSEYHKYTYFITQEHLEKAK